MTKKQWDKLKLGDIVTRTNGPNKDIPCIVVNKYLSMGAIKDPCLAAVPVDPECKLYVQNTRARNTNRIGGAASCFKFLKGEHK